MKGFPRSVIVFFLIFTPLTHAETEHVGRTMTQKGKADLVNQSNGPALNDSPSNIAGSNWQIHSGSDKSNVSIKVTPKNGWLNSSLTFEAPIAKGSDASSFNQSSEFVNDASVKLGFSYIHVPKSTEEKIDPFKVTELQKLCDKDRSPFEGLDEDLKCSEFKLSELEKAYKGEDDKGLDALSSYRSWSNETYFVYGASLGAGHDEFKYFKEDSLETEKKNETAWSASLSGSAKFPKIALVTLKLDYQNLYKASASVTRCPTGGTTETSNCASASGAKPKQVERLVTSLEGRFTTNSLELVKGVAPKLTYNDDDDKFSFNLPVFFLNDSKGVYNGGLNSSWNNAEHKWVFSVFVGAAFPEL